MPGRTLRWADRRCCLPDSMEELQMADHPIEIHIESHDVGGKMYNHVDIRPSTVRFLAGETVTWESTDGKFAIHFLDKTPFDNDKVVIHSLPPQLSVHKTNEFTVDVGRRAGSNPYHVAIEFDEDIHMSGSCSACYGC